LSLTRICRQRSRANQVRLWLSLLAYNQSNLWRRLALPAGIDRWSLTSFAAALGESLSRLAQV
jgi:hypothetical protein